MHYKSFEWSGRVRAHWVALRYERFRVMHAPLATATASAVRLRRRRRLAALQRRPGVAHRVGRRLLQQLAMTHTRQPYYLDDVIRVIFGRGVEPHIGHGVDRLCERASRRGNVKRNTTCTLEYACTRTAQRARSAPAAGESKPPRLGAGRRRVCVAAVLSAHISAETAKHAKKLQATCSQGTLIIDARMSPALRGHGVRRMRAFLLFVCELFIPDA